MAATTIKSWEKRLEQLEEMESSKAQQKAAAEVRKNQSEAKLERLRKSLTRLEEAAAAKSKKEEVPVAESQDTPVDDDVPLEDVDDDVPLEDIEDMHPEDVHGAEEEEEDIYEEETEEERAKRVASQWIPGEQANTETVGEEDAYEAPYEAPDETVTTETPPVESSPEEEESINEEVVEPTVEADDRMDLISRIKVWVSQMIARATGKVDLEQDLVVTKAKVEAAQKQFDSANQEFFTKSSELSTLQNEKGTLTSKLGTNYGTRNVFLQLSENCVEATIDKYVYEVCPFGDAHQSEGGRKTKLGTWKGFEGDTMMFTDGEGCWQGPSRSINVTLKCGSEDAFVSLAEPSRCTYTGVIRTPAHCTDELVENLEREVERKKTLLQEYNVKDEL
jgi:protein kinase C substrate 80K-H